MSYCDDDRYLNGPKLAEWLGPILDWETRDLESPFPIWVPNLRRRLSAWRRGECADFYRLEPYLFRLGLYATEVPEDLWLHDSPKSIAQLKRLGRIAA